MFVWTRQLADIRWPPSSHWCLTIRATLLLVLVTTPFAFCQQPDARQFEEPLFKQLGRQSQQSKMCSSLLWHLGRELDGSYPSGIRIKDLSHCVFHDTYFDTHMQRRRVFIFVPNLAYFPPVQRKTVAITDEQYQLLAWVEVSGARDLLAAQLSYEDDGVPVLQMTCAGTISSEEAQIYGLALKGDAIIPVENVDGIRLVRPQE